MFSTTGLLVAFAGSVPVFVSSAACPTAYCVLQSGYLRIGSGAQDSISEYGMHRQPWYMSVDMGNVFGPMTYTWNTQNGGPDPLSIAIGTGTTADHWSKSFVSYIRDLTPSLTVDYAGFVVTSTSGSVSYGYGTIVADNTVTVNGQSIKTVTTITNLDSANMENTLVWMGNPDQFLGPYDKTSLTRGNIVSGAFVPAASITSYSTAIKIWDTSLTDSAYLYSYDSCGRSVIGTYYGFDYAYDQDINNCEVEVFGDFSLAVLSNVGTIAPGDSTTYTWYVQGIGALPFAPKPDGIPACTNYITDETSAPSAEPTASPTDQPSAAPTAQPSAAPTAQPSAAPTAQPSTAPSTSTTTQPSAAPSTISSGSSGSKLLGSWCIMVGLFDTFGDGWGHGAALRIYDDSDPEAFIDVTNEHDAFTETTLCLNPGLTLYAEVICTTCDLKEPWEVYYTVTEKGSKKKYPKSLVGAFDTVMRFKYRDVDIYRNPIENEDDDKHSRRHSHRHRKDHCNYDKCSRNRDYRYADRVIDATGEGWYTESDAPTKVPEYNSESLKITGYSDLPLPKALTAPEIIISNAERNSIVHQGTICDSSKHTESHHHDHHHRHHKEKSVYSLIFCDKDSELSDGSYVFRIDGALSLDHPHSKTKWDFCGRRGTSDEELAMSGGSCHAVMKRSRWEISQSYVLADFMGSLTIQFDDIATIAAIQGADINEYVLAEVETALLASISSVNPMAKTVSINSLVFRDNFIEASFEVRLNTDLHETYKTSSYQGSLNGRIAGELQAQLSSVAFATKLTEELHQYPEFEASSLIILNGVKYEDHDPIQSHQAHTYDAGLEMSSKDSALMPLAFVTLVVIAGIVVVVAATTARHNAKRLIK